MGDAEVVALAVELIDRPAIPVPLSPALTSQQVYTGPVLYCGIKLYQSTATGMYQVYDGRDTNGILLENGEYPVFTMTPGTPLTVPVLCRSGIWLQCTAAFITGSVFLIPLHRL